MHFCPRPALWPPVVTLAGSYLIVSSFFLFAFEPSKAYNSSFVFVYLISVLVLREPVDVVKGAAVVVCLAGMTLMAISDGRGSHGAGLSTGVLVEISGSFLSAVYFVYDGLPISFGPVRFSSPSWGRRERETERDATCNTSTGGNPPLGTVT